MPNIALFDQENLDAPVPLGSLPWADRIEITARDLITERAILEWETRAKDDDREAAIAGAIEAFERGRFLLLADNRQIEGLDEAIVFAADAQVTFLRLAPLRGG